MALIVVFSTMSFMVDMHYCGDQLVDLAVFSDAKPCNMLMKQDKSKSICSVMKKNCCTDEQIAIAGQDELVIAKDILNLDQQIFVVAFIYTYSNLFEGKDKKVHSLGDHPPPLLVKDLPVLYESFLI